jgi:hypothetical protein
LELYEQRMAKRQIAQRLGKHRETIQLWISGIKELGLLGFLDKYRLAKQGERKRRQVNPPSSSGGCGKLENENMIVVGRRYNIFWSVKRKCISLSPKYMRFLLRSMLSVPNGRKTSKEERYRQLLSHDK